MTSSSVLIAPTTLPITPTTMPFSTGHRTFLTNGIAGANASTICLPNLAMLAPAFGNALPIHAMTPPSDLRSDSPIF
jgi:hypothetical protein